MCYIRCVFTITEEDTPHYVIDHEIEYVREEVHTKGIEKYWSILKCGVYGVFHQVVEGYLPMCLGGFEFRFNRRKMNDSERFAASMAKTKGRLRWYCQTLQPRNPHP